MGDDVSDSSETTPPAASAPDSLVVEDGMTCLACGYNLTGLSPGGVCPECGESISDSFNRGPLGFLEEQDAVRMLNGVRLLLLAAATAVINVILLVFSMISDAEFIARWICLPMLLVGLVMWIVGWHMIAAIKADGAGQGAPLVKPL